MLVAGSGQKGRSAVAYTFERESRTPYSEAYVIEDDGDAVGRVDLHFTTSGMVHATLCVPIEFDDDDLQDLIGEIDERLVLSTDVYRDDFIVTVWAGRHAGVYSEEMDEEDEEGSEGNGRLPGA
jgi:hypothetical protein